MTNIGTNLKQHSKTKLQQKSVQPQKIERKNRDEIIKNKKQKICCTL